MRASACRVDAAAVADLIDADLSSAARRWGLGETRSIVVLNRGTWPVTVTITSAEDREGISVSIEEQPFASVEPVEHAGAAVTLVCALLDEERTLARAARNLT